MSLIDEALRKASDRAGRDAMPIEPSSWVPAYGLDRRARRRRVVLVISLVAAAVAAASAYWLTTRTPSIRLSPKPRIAVAAPAASPLLEVVVPPPPGSALMRRRNANAAEPPPGDARRAQEGVRPKTRLAGAAPASAPLTVGAGPKTEAAPPQAPARPLADGRTYKGEVLLPGGGKISLDGIAYSETRPVAVINGRVLETGGMAEDFTVERIEPDRVTLSGRGMTIFLELK